MTDDEIGPWLSEAPGQQAKAARTTKTTRKSGMSPMRSKLATSQGHRAVRTTCRANVSPVSLQTPYFSVFSPSHTRKPFRNNHLPYGKLCSDAFGLYTQKVTKIHSTAIPEFDIVDAKKTLLRLSRTPKRTIGVGVGPEQHGLQLSTTSLISDSGGSSVTHVSDILSKPNSRQPSDTCPYSDYGSLPPSRYYRRRIKDREKPILSYYDYDCIAENISEQLTGLIGRKTRTAGMRRKSPGKVEASKDDFGVKLTGLVCGEEGESG